MARFIRIQNRMVNLDSIAYVDFLESGRAMIFVQGLTQEKQHVAVEPPDARRLKALLDAECVPDVSVADRGGTGVIPAFRSETSRPAF
jgi:hypothetical protein